jgi:hypothetical protein
VDELTASCFQVPSSPSKGTFKLHTMILQSCYYLFLGTISSSERFLRKPLLGRTLILWSNWTRVRGCPSDIDTTTAFGWLSFLWNRSWTGTEGASWRQVHEGRQLHGAEVSDFLCVAPDTWQRIVRALILCDRLAVGVGTIIKLRACSGFENPNTALWQPRAAGCMVTLELDGEARFEVRTPALCLAKASSSNPLSQEVGNMHQPPPSEFEFKSLQIRDERDERNVFYRTYRSGVSTVVWRRYALLQVGSG